MKKAVIATMLSLIMAMLVFSFALPASAQTVPENAGEWDASVPVELSEELQSAFAQATGGLLGVHYEPVAVLAQKGEDFCILCKATVVYPDAQPSNKLLFLRCGDSGAEVTEVRDLPLDAQAAQVEIDYGMSDLYTAEEMDAAIACIRREFDSWEGCELHSIRYFGDDQCTAENLEWLNSLGDGPEFTQCIAFVSDFHSPREAVGAWNPDTEYTGWQWWLARTGNGDWELLNWGY